MYHLLILPEVIGAFEDGNRAEGPSTFSLPCVGHL